MHILHGENGTIHPYSFKLCGIKSMQVLLMTSCCVFYVEFVNPTYDSLIGRIYKLFAESLKSKTDSSKNIFLVFL